MSAADSGGAYSLARLALGGIGAAVGVAAAGLDGPLALFAGAAALLTGAGFAIGLLPRWCGYGLFAIDLWILSAGAPTPGAVALLWTILLWASAPPDPWGSWERRGEPDPGSDWRLPGWIRAALWPVIAAAIGAGLGQALADGNATAVGALTALGAASGGVAAALASTRRGLWLVLGLAWLVAGGIGGPDGLLLLAWLCLAESRWLPDARPGALDDVFYDGSCALCHGTVRFLIAEDPGGERFRFAPLGGDRIAARLRPEQIAALPDAVVVVTPDGELRVESEAMLHAARRLGGPWRLLGEVASWIPRGLRDLVYRAVARTRYRVFGTKPDACPLLPPELRQRIDP